MSSLRVWVALILLAGLAVSLLECSPAADDRQRFRGQRRYRRRRRLPSIKQANFGDRIGVRRRNAAGRSLSNLVLGGTSRFGRPSGSVAAFTNFPRRQDDWDRIWTGTGIVPKYVPDLPDGRLQITYPAGVQIRPNDTLTSGLMLQFPQLSWESDPNSLYTVMIVDLEIERPEGDTNFFHFLETNVRGNDIGSGTEVYSYIPPFAFLYNPQQGLIRDPTFAHAMGFLVYRQNGRVDAQPEGDYCSPAVFLRVQQYLDYVSSNNLDPVPVAGNFLKARYSGDTTDKFLCIFTRCTGNPFPAPIPGINDGPECQPRQQDFASNSVGLR